MKKILRKAAMLCIGASIIASSFGCLDAKANTVAAGTPLNAFVNTTASRYAGASGYADATTTQAAYDDGSAATSQAVYANNDPEVTVNQAAYMEQKSALDNISYLFNVITSSYACDIDYKEMRINMLKAMLSSLDPYSVYMEPQKASDFKDAVDSHTGGIGVVMELKDKKYVIGQVTKGSPAEKAGVKAGDIIDSVDGYATSKITEVGDLGERVRGKVGTVVKLVLIRNNKKINFSIKRDTIVLPSVGYKLLTKDMGYIQITQIAADTYTQFSQAENYFKQKGIKNIILDLRDNGGGYMSVAGQICSDIIPKGKIGSEQFTGYPKQDIMSNLEKAPFKIAVLMNRNTASAAEFIAGAIQDRGVGILVGEKSYGKSVVQQIVGVDMDDVGNIRFDAETEQGNIGSVKLTVGKYYTPNGKFINGVGLKAVAYAQYASVYDYDGAKAFDYKTALKVNFKNGTKDKVVKSIEQKLKLLKYNISPDDVFDKDTTSCINKYQHDKKIKVKKYGVIDEATLKKLDADIKALSTHDLQLDRAQHVLEVEWK